MIGGRYRRLLGRRPAAEVDAELRMHFELLVESYVERGLSEPDARRAAESRLGNLRAVRGDCIAIDTRLQRRETVTAMWETLTQDVRLAARLFARQKLWTALAVLTLGLGIGANSALFSIVNAVLLRPLPFADPDRIISVTTALDGSDLAVVQEPTYVAWKSRAKSFSALAAYRGASTVLKGAGDPEIVSGRNVTHGYFAVFGVAPMLGRIFAADEDVPGGPRVALLSEQLWRRMYGGDSSIIGRTILMDENPATVIGVMPATFTTKASAQYWMPYRMRPSASGSVFYTSVAGRLAPNATIESARAELQTMIPPQTGASKAVVTPVLMTLHERKFGDTRPTLLMLFAAVGVLLLIACANVANLLLARAARRQREFAVRAAIGASSWRLIRFTLCESTLLALMGGAVGLVLARLTLGTFVRLSPPTIAGADGISVDATVVFFAFSVALATGIVFGLIPALQIRRVDVNSVLTNNATRMTGSSRQAWLRRGLVVAELATALMLVTAAGLLTKSFARVTSIDTGIDPSRIVVATMGLSRGRYKDETAVAGFYDRFVAAVSAIPGVESVALTDAAPIGGRVMSRSLGQGGGRGPQLDISAVGRSYFKTVGMALVAGRAFDATDVANSEPVAILNETAARILGKNGKVVGERLPLGSGNTPIRIVGIAHDALQRGIEDAVPAMMYVPMEQDGGPNHYTTVLARTAGEPAAIVPALREIVRRLDPQQPIPEIKTMESRLSEAVAPRRFTFALLTAFASIGALLAMIGLYGVMSYLVAERTNEIGVRVALGADSRRIMGFIVGEGMLLVIAGVVLGLAGSLAGVRLLRTMLFRVSVYDPTIFIIGAALLIATAMVACIVPARRAAGLDPVEALRAG